jgi:hypothetical protein
MKLAGRVVRTAKMRNTYTILAGKPEGTRSLKRPNCRWGDNIKIYLGEIGLEDVDRIRLAMDKDCWRALVNMVMNVRVPFYAGNFLTNERRISF